MSIPAPSNDLTNYFRIGENRLPGTDVVIPANVVDWDTSQVFSMAGTFSADPGFTTRFNFDIGGWDTSNVVRMDGMFRGANLFNQDISGWDVSNVTVMGGMFVQAESFNQDISGWDVSSVEFMQGMFFEARAFDQNLGAWDITNLRGGSSMLRRSGMSMENMDATIEGWLDLFTRNGPHANGVGIGAEGVLFSNWDARETLYNEYRVYVGADYYLAGTPEDDLLDGTDGGFRIVTDGQEGDDRILGNHRNDRLAGGQGEDTLEGGGGQDTLTGGIWNDVLYGGSSAPNLADLGDSIFAGQGDDWAHGGAGNDDIRGDAGHDTLTGGTGSDSLYGGIGDDVLTGSSLSDLLVGGDGMDFLNGGFGNDRLNGGAGADRFFHLGLADHGTDWIQDYGSNDVLVYGGGPASVDDFQVNRANTANAGATDIDEAFVIYRPTGQILWALVDGGGTGAITLRLAGQEVDLLAI